MVGGVVGLVVGACDGDTDGDLVGADVGAQVPPGPRVPQHLFPQIREYVPPAQQAVRLRGPAQRSTPMTMLDSEFAGQAGAAVGDADGATDGEMVVGGDGEIVGLWVGSRVGAGSAQQRVCRTSLGPAHRLRPTGPIRTPTTPPTEEPSSHVSPVHTSMPAPSAEQPTSGLPTSSSREHSRAPMAEHPV